MSASRGSATLDLCATNINPSLKECLNHVPLETPAGQKSDHAFISFRFALNRRHEFKWVKRKTRKITAEAERAFSAELEDLKWTAIVETDGLDGATHVFHNKLAEMTARHFPVTWHKVRSTDDPWIDAQTRAMIKKRILLFAMNKKRCCEWKRLKKVTDSMIRTRKKQFYAKDVEKLSQNGAHQVPYKTLKNIADKERPPVWSAEDLAVGTLSLIHI